MTTKADGGVPGVSRDGAGPLLLVLGVQVCLVLALVAAQLPLLPVLGAALALCCLLLRKRAAGAKDAPSPPYTPLAGHFLQIFPPDGSAGQDARLYDWFVELARRHDNTWLMRLPFSELSYATHFVHTTDPANVEHVLRGNFENFPKGPVFRELFADLLGDGIFNADGHHWLAQRKAASKEFSVNKFRHFMSDVFLRHGAALVRRLRAQIPPRTTTTAATAATTARLTTAAAGVAGAVARGVDMQKLFSKFTLQSIAAIGFGVDLGCLENEADVPFESAFDAATHLTMMRFMTPHWKLLRWCGRGGEGKLARHVAVIREFSAGVISARRALARDDLEARDDLLSRFMLLQHDGVASAGEAAGGDHQGGAGVTDDYLRDIVVNFILAGRDTTANALSWLFLSLARHPRVERKLRGELGAAGLLRRHGGSSSTGAAALGPSFDALQVRKLPYLHACVTETLRLFPSVPSDVKSVLADDVLPSGHTVHAGSWISYDPYAMGRQTSIWGEDAAVFRPERFLKLPDIGADQQQHGQQPAEGGGQEEARKPEFVKPSPFSFTAFQAGKRLCLGIDMAYFEVKSAACQLLREFEFTLSPGQGDITYTRSLTLPLTSLRMDVALRAEDTA